VIRVEEQDVGPAEEEPESEQPKKSNHKESAEDEDDSGSKKHNKSEPTEKYEAPIIALDEENDPKWYRSHMSTYPCYKLTDSALYNFQYLKNLDDDWSAAGADKKTPATINFNICHYTDTSGCGDSKGEDAFAFRQDQEGKCEMLTSTSPQAELAEEVTRANPSDPDSTQRGIRLLRGGGDTCP